METQYVVNITWEFTLLDVRSEVVYVIVNDCVRVARGSACSGNELG